MSKITKFASESVCAGHPDKICDQISDAILDACLGQDPKSRVAIETFAANNSLVLGGELTTNAKIDTTKIAKQQIKRLGYIDPNWGFSDQSSIVSYIHQQSPEIALGVDLDGAGDQGLMFGYANNDTTEYLPLPITLAHELTQHIDQVRENKTIDYLRPDGKAQVVVDYANDKPVSISHVTIAVPHHEDISADKVSHDVYKHIITPILSKFNYEIDTKNVVVNGTGLWHIPGPRSDCGLTGRKIVVDGYGGFARVGGGAFSGKDPSKVDRSGAYAARYIAKNIVAHGLADKAEVALAYYIGAKKPVLQTIDTFNTAKVSQKSIEDFSKKLLETSVKGIINTLNLQRPIYLQTAAYGHFGRSQFPWEKVVY